MSQARDPRTGRFLAAPPVPSPQPGNGPQPLADPLFPELSWHRTTLGGEQYWLPRYEIPKEERFSLAHNEFYFYDSDSDPENTIPENSAAND